MRPIVIGAGRGSRLGPETDEVPKALVPVMGRPMLDWILDALGAGGFARKDVLFIGGYKIDVVRARYPELSYVENRDWERNNILGSLLCARESLSAGFVSTYADIVYRGSTVKKLVASPHDKVLACDTDWRRRYVDRSQHPETDGEKMRAEGDRVVELSRRIPSEKASGEFIGVMKFSADGAREMVGAFDEARARQIDRPLARRAHLRARLPHRSLPGDDRAGLRLPSRRHPRRLHGNRYGGRPGLRREVVARIRA